MKNEWEVFCREYLALGFNGTRAYLSSYPESSVKAAGTSAYALLKNPQIQQHLSELIKVRMDRLDIQADDVLRLLWQTATADPNELIEVRRECCRYCYGDDHKYQYTIAEWEEKKEAGENEKYLGGVGFMPKMTPVPTCPECFGDGVERAVFKDTRLLSPAAKQLYAGAKVTAGGLEIKMHSRDKALELIGRHLAMFTDNQNHTNDGKEFKPMELTDFYAKPDAKPST